MALKREEVQQVRSIARKTFGYKDLRPGQEAAIKSVLEGRDTLAVMPTGSGKSAIYQIAGLQIPGATIVVSPMIALQRDQFQAIKEQEVAEVAVLNSTIKAAERREAFESLKEGSLEFLLLAPEQFNNDEVLESLRAAKPSLFVVDEAHCISEWGHDFRPDYLKLGNVIEKLGHPTILALTATASPPVREEIMERLGMRKAKIVVQGFDRPNIWLGVERYDEELPKRNAIIERTVEAEKPGIIYAATRKRAEELAAGLVERGVKAVAYHAGMKAADREQIQTAFMSSEGDAEVIVATTAFGMGVDKANVRFVFHYDISDSVDAYYQEIGRAGRDGEDSRAVLFYRPQDLGIRRFFAGSGQVDIDQVERVVQLVKIHGDPVEPSALQEESGLSQTKLATVLHRLEEVGAVKILPSGEVAPGKRKFDSTDVAGKAAQEQERHQKFSQSQLEMMQGYAELQDCRRRYLLNYFGEDPGEPCGFCDNCEAGLVIEEPENEDKPFPLNSRVAHKSWGEGIVMRYEGDKIVVLFDQVGYKSLAVNFALENNLLAAVG
jgi:ATP-dependent DNA helicase RecQ